MAKIFSLEEEGYALINKMYNKINKLILFITKIKRLLWVYPAKVAKTNIHKVII